jgi:ribose/xylose/arabinose/galactoside ABC-type transport system permease subunit
MSALTIFLGRLIGVYCLVVGLMMMANRRTMVDAVNALIRSPPLVLLAGVFAVAVGLGLVIGYSVWTGGALPVVVTLVGWASLIKGLCAFGASTWANGEALRDIALRAVLSCLCKRNVRSRPLPDD